MGNKIGMGCITLVFFGMAWVIALIAVDIGAIIISVPLSDTTKGWIAAAIALICIFLLEISKRNNEQVLKVHPNHLDLQLINREKKTIHKKDIQYIFSVNGQMFITDHHNHITAYKTYFNDSDKNALKRHQYPLTEKDPYEAQYIKFKEKPSVDPDVQADLQKAYEDIEFSVLGAGRLNKKYWKRGYIIKLDKNNQIKVLKLY